MCFWLFPVSENHDEKVEEATLGKKLKRENDSKIFIKICSPKQFLLEGVRMSNQGNQGYSGN